MTDIQIDRADEQQVTAKTSGFEDFGELMFRLRDYTPIPLVILMFFAADPSVVSATVGTLCALFGEMIRLYSVAFIGSVSRTRSESTGPKLIRLGTYGMVRNPLYIGNFFIVLGIAVYTAVWWLILLSIVLFFIQYYAIVSFEEKTLRQKFGSEFDEYANEVPAWIPKSLPSLEEWSWPDTFSPALKSEKRTLTAIALMLLLLAIFAK